MRTDIHDMVAAARSWLFTPGTRPDRYAKAALSGADAVILDLEDSVADGEKASARRHVLDYLASPRDNVIRAVRINALGTLAGLRDVVEFVDSDADPDIVVLPKAEAPGDIAQLRQVLGESGKRAAVIPIVESARGLLNLQSILFDTESVAAVMVGAADLAADIGGQPDSDSVSIARCHILISAAAARIPVIDSPFFDARDTGGLTAETESAYRSGFTAKAAIHPHQVSVINERFTPTQAQCAWAHRVLEVNDAGVGTIDGQMVDEAVARRARRILARST